MRMAGCGARTPARGTAHGVGAMLSPGPLVPADCRQCWLPSEHREDANVSWPPQAAAVAAQACRREEFAALYTRRSVTLVNPSSWYRHRIHSQRIPKMKSSWFRRGARFAFLTLASATSTAPILASGASAASTEVTAPQM